MDPPPGSQQGTKGPDLPESETEKAAEKDDETDANEDRSNPLQSGAHNEDQPWSDRYATTVVARSLD